ncbi:MAG: phosphatidylserine/phosphatidylglycerophosphate/cardiolipin synthase family protein [Synechococcaceae cyanobacterium]|nr:phosphatidylserine/phosphatidylglycerophosphate/cardiolipin synthase family protein [Synechococcaceae cyanobacterium]
MALLLAGCGAAPALRLGGPAPLPPLPAGLEVAFNHRSEHQYRSPIDGRWRQGDDLEALILDTIASARRELLVAVQELSLPRVAEALVRRHREGLRVQVVLENTYSQPWSRQHLIDQSPHQRQRTALLQRLGQGDAVEILQRGGVPLLDDTADGSAGSGLMHHKFLVADRSLVVTGSANFSPSCIHGDADAPRSRGNVNHLLRLRSPALAQLFVEEFQRLWGDGPGGRPDSRFGLAKGSGPARVVLVGTTPVEVLFAPHRRSDPSHGLLWLQRQLLGVRQRLDLSLFVFSAQNLADALVGLRQRGVALRLLADPGFAHRSFSEVLDLLGVAIPDRQCRLEAGNRPWGQALAAVGIPRLAGGDKLHHKFAVLDGRRVISGSFNWSPSAAHQNDELLLRIDSPALAQRFQQEMDRLWRGAELGHGPRLQRRRQRHWARCGSGRARDPIAPDTTLPTIRPSPLLTRWIRPRPHASIRPGSTPSS